MKYGIRYKYNDKRADCETLWKGYRGDVLVIVDDKRYNIDLEGINRLSYTRTMGKDYFPTEANKIIVKEVTKKEIVKTINELVKTDFFKKLGANDINSIDINDCKNVSNLLNDRIEIYYLNNSDEHYDETCIAGYRDDVIVKIDQRIYNVRIMRIDRILQDYEYEMRTNGYYLTSPNLIIVKQMDKICIEKTIVEQYKRSFFKKLGPLQEKDNWGIFEYLHAKH